MSTFSYLSNANPAFIEEQYLKYKENPESVDSEWAKFFEGYDFAATSNTAASSGDDYVSDKEVGAVKLIQGFRTRGHLIANTNPVRQRRKHKSDLELSYFGFSESDLDTEFNAGHDIKIGKATLRNILDHLRRTYCENIGVEFMYCRDEQLRQWMYNEMETIGNKPVYSNEEKHHILNKINQSVTFESFLQTKYVGKKRFSLEGLEAFIPSIDAAIRQGVALGAEEFVLGMAHRGRLNVLVNIFEKSYDDIFSEFEENAFTKDFELGGDVKYHLGKSADIKVDGKKVHLSLVPNPSHLEAVGPVLQGIAYSKNVGKYKDSNKIIPIIVHGDAAMSGQGVNYEMANMSKLDGFSVGGSVHVILNNQVGFTANYKESRSSVYCTDLAKVTESPVFHVNADDPLAVVHAMKMAVKIRQQFKIDVFVDILGYRRYGHNEGDEPRFTQPLLYKTIQKHANVYKVFLSELVSQQDISQEQATKMVEDFKNTLQTKLESAKNRKTKLEQSTLQGVWKGYREAVKKDFDKSIETGVDKKALDKVFHALTRIPESFNLFSKMKKIIDQRVQLYTDSKVDWALAEQLAFGSILNEDHPVRLTGQDSQRGTFSHRHAVITDTETEEQYTPLNNIKPKQPKFQVYNSFLSEYCASGFEYGFSLASPHALTIWEAQFGDFSNGAQIVFDQFVSSAEYKWKRMSGLVLLLPHGYEGQGPEHSSARLERYLQLCAQNNMLVTNISTPANFFHALRRQIHAPYRKPLVVMSPKSLLRHAKAISKLSDLEKGHFQEVIDDDVVKSSAVKRVVICSGKIYYDLLEYQEENKINDVAILRLEQMYPLPKKQLDALRKKYKTKEWFWVQEEPENMGAWAHILRHLSEWNLSVICREESASPATGSSKIHAKHQANLVIEAMKRS